MAPCSSRASAAGRPALAVLCAAAAAGTGASACVLGECGAEVGEEAAALLQHTKKQGHGRRPSKVSSSAQYGLDLPTMDASVAPGEDFYRYVNGKWLNSTYIPSDQTSVSSFSILDDKVQDQLHQLLRDAAPDSLQGAFYKSFMDKATVEKLGAKPLLEEIAQIAALKDMKAFAKWAGSTNAGFGRSPFEIYIGADPKEPKVNVAHLAQSGLGLPRDYYLDQRFAEIVVQYEGHIEKALQKVSWPNAHVSAKSVVALERRIAKASWPEEDLRNPLKTYNKMTPATLKEKVPGFHWGTFMTAAGDIPSSATLIVSAYREEGKDGIPGIALIISQENLHTLKAWAAFHTVADASPYLSQDFVELHFEFFGKTLSGQQEPKVRWKRAVSAANAFVGDAVGKEFVAKFFPEAARTKMGQLTTLLKRAFQARLEKLSWMTAETKAKALTKLQGFTFEIGSPKMYRQYEGLVLNADDLYGNVAKATAWAWRFDLDKLGKPVDNDYWDTVPQAINAFFDPTQNRCVFLAAILQEPFFSADADMAVNFGGIGAVIGHEMTHGFDDSGRRYDAQGKLNDWWTEADSREFTKRAKAYGRQFDEFRLLMPEGLHINPHLTMGENIADLGGVTIAYDAYHMWLQDNAASPVGKLLMPNRDGLEGDRRFFASWGQVWRSKYTESAITMQVKTNPHSPSQARAIIPVQNSDPFYDAFSVVEGQALYLPAEKRVHIW